MLTSGKGAQRQGGEVRNPGWNQNFSGHTRIYLKSSRVDSILNPHIAYEK